MTLKNICSSHSNKSDRVVSYRRGCTLGVRSPSLEDHLSAFFNRQMRMLHMTSIDIPSSRRCLGTTAQGRPCRAWAVKGGSYCVVHNSQEGAPPGGRDRDPPRRESDIIDDLIEDMLGRLSILSAMIDQAEDTDLFLKTLTVYSRCIVHLSSLLRTKRSLGEPADDVLDMIGQAAEQLAEEQGWTIFESFNR